MVWSFVSGTSNDIIFLLPLELTSCNRKKSLALNL